MIIRITQKEYYARKKRAKYTKKSGVFPFKAINDRYYLCDRSDMIGVREMFEFNKQLKNAKATQTSLLDENH